VIPKNISELCGNPFDPNAESRDAFAGLRGTSVASAGQSGGTEALRGEEDANETGAREGFSPEPRPQGVPGSMPRELRSGAFAPCPITPLRARTVTLVSIA
jgi:hypothetical protein